MEKLPKGYYIPAPGEHPAGTTSQQDPGMAFPNGRPGHPITWDDAHGAWRPPGFTPDAGDSDRIFNSTTGQNGVWDDKSGKWIDTKTGQPISYEQ